MPDIISVAVFLVVSWALAYWGRPAGRVLRRFNGATSFQTWK